MKKIISIFIIFFILIILNHKVNSVLNHKVNSNETDDGYENFLNNLFSCINNDTIVINNIEFIWNNLDYTYKNKTYHTIEDFKKRCYEKVTDNIKCKIIFDIFGIL